MRLPNSLKLYLALVFLSGVIVGGVGVQLYNTRSVSAKAPFNPDEARKRYAEELRARLSLNAAQIQQLDGILLDTHSQYRQLREKYRPEVRAIQEQQADRIRQILDPRQLEEYEKMRQEREKHRQRSSQGRDRWPVGV